MSVVKIESIEQLDSTVNNDKLVLVEFYADWCPPCHRFAYTLEKISNEFAGALIVAKVNVYELDDVLENHGINCMPTFIFYKNGTKVDKVEGADKKSVRDMILKHK